MRRRTDVLLLVVVAATVVEPPFGGGSAGPPEAPGCTASDRVAGRADRRGRLSHHRVEALAGGLKQLATLFREGHLGVVRADVVDRVVASAGQQVVTLSAVRRQLRIEALVANKEPEYSAASMRRAAERLIEQALVLREMELSMYAAPPMAEAEATLEKFISSRKQTPAEFSAQRARLGFSEDDFKNEVLWRISVQRFVNFRFAPGVQVSDEEIERYYREDFSKRAKAADTDVKMPMLDEVRDTIRLILATRKTNQALEVWLAQTRETLKVHFFEEALKP